MIKYRTKKSHIYDFSIFQKFLLIIFPLGFIFFSLFIGVYNLSFSEVLSCLFFPKQSSFEIYTIVWNLRFPRALAAAFVGASLAVSGSAFQGVFHNPLVNSGMLGVSSGAGFGCAIAIVFFGGGTTVYISSFFFGILAVVLALFAGNIYGQISTTTLILGGVVVSGFFSALISVLKYVADPYSQLPSITFWLMGSFSSIDKSHFTAFLPMTLGILMIWLSRWRINALSLGNKEAAALGVDTKLYNIMIIGGATLCTAASVCISGTIGWVGLVVPHIGRMLGGNDNIRLIPLSACMGACYMILIDVISRSISSTEIPIGILTALVGTPFFVWLLKKTKGAQWQ